MISKDRYDVSPTGIASIGLHLSHDLLICHHCCCWIGIFLLLLVSRVTPLPPSSPRIIHQIVELTSSLDLGVGSTLNRKVYEQQNQASLTHSYLVLSLLNLLGSSSLLPRLPRPLDMSSNNRHTFSSKVTSLFPRFSFSIAFMQCTRYSEQNLQPQLSHN